MKINKDNASIEQRGAVTLFVSIILLVAVTIIIIFAARVGVLDQRISGNEARYKASFANAEAGLEQSAAYLRANPILHDGNPVDGWNSCAGNLTVFPCDIPNAESVYGTITNGVISSSVASVAALAQSQSFLVKTNNSTVAIGIGTSDDGSGEVVTQVEFVKTTILTPGQVPPLMVPGGNLSGNFNIVPNPNGGGPGVPISVWSKDGLQTSGANWKTCDHHDYRDGGQICMDTKGDGATGQPWLPCRCSSERSNSGNVGSDIVRDNANFPDSPFVYLFGDEGAGDTLDSLKPEIKAIAQANGTVYADGTNLASKFAGVNSTALVWITGDATIGSNVTVGSRDKPIILVVEGELRVNAGAEVWGVLVGLGDFVLNGGPVIHGSAISEENSDLTNGTYYQVYDDTVFENLREDTINSVLAKRSYSWRDFNP